MAKSKASVVDQQQMPDPIPASACEGMTTVFDFIMKHGRPPFLIDERKPWSFCGWLLYYVQMAHSMGMCGNRWGYHLRQMDAGKLLDEPIPQIKFHENGGDKSVLTEIADWSRLVGWDMGGWSDFGRLMEWLAFALGFAKEAPRLSDEANEKLYRGVNLQKMLQAPSDYWGQVISEMKAPGWNPTAFHPTPHCVVQCMMSMVASDEDLRTKTTNDPCIGTGRMLLEASNYSLRLSGQDIDPQVIRCALINGALYSPWMTFPYPDSFFDAPALPTSARRQVAPEQSAPAEQPVVSGPLVQKTLFDALAGD